MWLFLVFTSYLILGGMIGYAVGRHRRLRIEDLPHDEMCEWDTKRRKWRCTTCCPVRQETVAEFRTRVRILHGGRS
jgi:hypothetical protein